MGSAIGACVEGTTVPCTINGCKGIRECVGGRMTGCQIENQCTPPPPGPDKMTVSGAVPLEDVGVLFDGRTSTASMNDSRRNETANSAGEASLVLETLVGGAFGNIHSAFSIGRSPTSAHRIWNQTAETMPLVLDPEVGLRVTFWVLSADFSTLLTRGAQAIVDLNAVYRTERTGLRVTGVTFRDASTNASAAALLDAQAGNKARYVNEIGQTAGEMNVYVTNTVEGANNRAFTWDGNPLTTIAGNVLIGRLLAHEFGHAFVLAHVGAPDFDGTNIMSPDVSASQFFTEGQIFNMHRHPSSLINALFNAHPGRQTFACPGPATNECPAVSRRVWPDGTFPAN